MATTLTTTSVNITGNFDIQVLGRPTDPAVPFTVVLKKALGGDAASEDFDTVKVFGAAGHHFVGNNGENSFKLAAAVAGVTVKFNQ